MNKIEKNILFLRPCAIFSSAHMYKRLAAKAPEAPFTQNPLKEIYIDMETPSAPPLPETLQHRQENPLHPETAHQTPAAPSLPEAAQKTPEDLPLPKALQSEILALMLLSSSNKAKGFWIMDVDEYLISVIDTHFSDIETFKSFYKEALKDSQQSKPSPEAPEDSQAPKTSPEAPEDSQTPKTLIKQLETLFETNTYSIFKDQVVNVSQKGLHQLIKKILTNLSLLTDILAIKTIDFFWSSYFLISPEYIHFLVDNLLNANFKVLGGDCSLKDHPYNKVSYKKLKNNLSQAYPIEESISNNQTVCWMHKFSNVNNRYEMLEFLYFADAVLLALLNIKYFLLYLAAKNSQSNHRKLKHLQSCGTLQEEYFNPAGMLGNNTLLDSGGVIKSKYVPPIFYESALSNKASEAHNPLDKNRKATMWITSHPKEEMARDGRSGRWLKLKSSCIFEEADLLCFSNTQQEIIQEHCTIKDPQVRFLFGIEENSYYLNPAMFEWIQSHPNELKDLKNMYQEGINIIKESFKLPDNFNAKMALEEYLGNNQENFEEADNLSNNSNAEMAPTKHLGNKQENLEEAEELTKKKIKREFTTFEKSLSNSEKILDILKDSESFFEKNLSNSNNFFQTLSLLYEYKGEGQELLQICLDLFSLPHFSKEEKATYCNPDKPIFLILEGPFGSGKSTALKVMQSARELFAKIIEKNTEKCIETLRRKIQQPLHYFCNTSPQDLIYWRDSVELAPIQTNILLLNLSFNVMSKLLQPTNLIHPYINTLIIIKVFGEKIGLRVPTLADYLWISDQEKDIKDQDLKVSDFALPVVLYLATIALSVLISLLEHQVLLTLKDKILPQIIHRNHKHALLDDSPSNSTIISSPGGIRIENLDDMRSQNPELYAVLVHTFNNQRLTLNGAVIASPEPFSVFASENNPVTRENWQIGQYIPNFIPRDTKNLENTLKILLYKALKKNCSFEVQLTAKALDYFAEYPQKIITAILKGFNKSKPKNKVCLQRELFDLTAKKLIILCIYKRDRLGKKDWNTISDPDMVQILDENTYLKQNLIQKVALAIQNKEFT